MAFRKMDVHKLPARQWLLLGFPGCGKSTFSAQMKTPILPLDSDHRYAEVASLAGGDVLELFDPNEEGQDYTDVQKIADLLHENMPGSGVKTIVVDSLTSIIAPKTTQAVMDNDAGKNKNRIAAFKDKALSMRLLQDTLTGFGIDLLWIAHLRTSLNASAKEIESSTITAVELARLRRSINIEMRVIEAADGARGIQIDWARNGRTGIKIWDESGTWQNMPAKIEEAVYGGLSKADMEKLAKQTPTSFASPESAIAWGFDQNCFRDAVHAKNAYDKLKADKKPLTAAAMWTLWISDVERRKASGVIEDDQPQATEAEAEPELSTELIKSLNNAAETKTDPVAEQVDPPVAKTDLPDPVMSKPTLWDTLSELYGEQLNPASRQLMAAWLLRQYTLKATPKLIRESEDKLTDEEVAAVMAALIKNSANYLKRFTAEQAKLAQAEPA